MYMSPEQCAGARAVDARTDVYSLGCVLYQALAGRPPFVAEGTGELIGMHLYQAPPQLGTLVPKVPATVTALVHRLLTKEAKKRPVMSDAADEIGQVLSRLVGGAAPVRSRGPTNTDPGAALTDSQPGAATTMSQSTGQAAAPTGRRTWLVASGVVGIGLSLLAVGMVRQRSTPTTGAPLASPPAPAPPGEAAARRLVQWRIDSVPEDATVLNQAGQIVGKTPWVWQQEAGAGQEEFRLVLDGYVDGKAELLRAADTARKVVLVAKPSSPARREPSKTSKAPATGRTRAPKKAGIAYED